MNSDDENRLVYPANVDNTAEKAAWLYHELERIFRDNNDIEKMCIKTNEFTQTDTKPKRESAHLEGVVILFCAHKRIVVESKIYSSLKTNSRDVRSHAEERVGKTDRYWDTKMADAVIAAWHGLNT